MTLCFTENLSDSSRTQSVIHSDQCKHGFQLSMPSKLFKIPTLPVFAFTSCFLPVPFRISIMTSYAVALGWQHFIWPKCSNKETICSIKKHGSNEVNATINKFTSYMTVLLCLSLFFVSNDLLSRMFPTHHLSLPSLSKQSNMAAVTVRHNIHSNPILECLSHCEYQQVCLFTWLSLPTFTLSITRYSAIETHWPFMF